MLTLIKGKYYQEQLLTLFSDRADFRARKVIRDKERYYAMIKTSHQRKYAGGK